MSADLPDVVVPVASDDEREAARNDSRATADVPRVRPIIRSGEQRTVSGVEDFAALWPGERFSSTSDEFSARLLRLDLAHLTLDAVWSAPYVAVRDRALISRFPRGTVALDVVLTGALWRQHAGGRDLQAEGEVCLTVVDEPFSFGWIRGGRSVRTMIAIKNLPEHLRQTGALRSGVIAFTPLVASYVGFLEALISAANPDSVHCRQLESAVMNLHRAVVLEATRPVVDERPSLRARIDACIEERFADPLLTPTSIAQALQVSLRAVHQAVEGDGPTLGGQIRARRVRAAATALQDEPVPPSMRELAEQFGFRGIDHLRRSFHMVLGMNPSTFRNIHLASARTVG